MDDQTKIPAPTAADRRPIKARSSWWAPAFTQILVRAQVTPNQVSVTSILFAAIGATCLALEARSSAPPISARRCTCCPTNPRTRS